MKWRHTCLHDFAAVTVGFKLRINTPFATATTTNLASLSLCYNITTTMSIITTPHHIPTNNEYKPFSEDDCKGEIYFKVRIFIDIVAIVVF
jgi:hypothetical protein